MNRRVVMSAMVLAASMLGTQALYAAPGHLNTPVHAAVEAKAKMIKFSVRNDSNAVVRFKAGDNELAVAPGKTTALALPEGTQLITVEAANREPGSVIATVSNVYSGSTLALR